MDLYVGIPQRLLSGLATVPTCKSRYLGEPAAGVEPSFIYVLRIFLKVIFFFVIVPTRMGLHAGVCTCECGCLQRPETWGPLELQLQAEGGPSSRVLGMELQLSGRSSKCPSLLSHLSNPVVHVSKIKKALIPRATGERTGTFGHPK